MGLVGFGGFREKVASERLRSLFSVSLFIGIIRGVFGFVVVWFLRVEIYWFGSVFRVF